MRVYDTDDADESATLATRIAGDDLWERNLLSTFAPDTIDEARNRGFKPVRRKPLDSGSGGGYQ